MCANLLCVPNCWATSYLGDPVAHGCHAFIGWMLIGVISTRVRYALCHNCVKRDMSAASCKSSQWAICSVCWSCDAAMLVRIYESWLLLTHWSCCSLALNHLYHFMMFGWCRLLKYALDKDETLLVALSVLCQMMMCHQWVTVSWWQYSVWSLHRCLYLCHAHCCIPGGKQHQILTGKWRISCFQNELHWFCLMSVYSAGHSSSGGPGELD